MISKAILYQQRLRNFIFRNSNSRKINFTGNTFISNHVILKGNLFNIHIGDKLIIDNYVTLECGQDNSCIKIGDNTIIKQFSIISTHGGNIEIGKNCSINPFCVLYGLGGLTIGNFVRIATHTVIVPANHIFDDLNVPIKLQGLSKKGVIIEDDVWIGAGVRILDGVTVGQGSVIGAGTVLTKTVEPYSIVVGVPGKVIKNRREK